MISFKGGLSSFWFRFKQKRKLTETFKYLFTSVPVAIATPELTQCHSKKAFLWNC